MINTNKKIKINKVNMNNNKGMIRIGDNNKND
jgi:hypothetical protein